ncbi:MAG: MFS transporter [Cyanobacteria bacterium J06634_5]
MTLYTGLLSAIHPHISSLLAQADAVIVDGVQAVPVPVEVPVAVQPPQLLLAVLSGVILAFGFQLLLTNLSVAAGVSYVAHAPSSSGSDSDSSSGIGIKTIGIAFGLWTLITVSLALFFACWLAVKLSIYPDPWTGAVTGLVIWALYFSLLTWFSSTAVGSLVGSVVRSATNGFQAMVGTATAALGANAAGNEVVQTAEAAAAAIRREFTQGIDTTGIQNSLQDYVSSLKSSDVDVSAIEQEFERLVRSSDIASVDRDALPEIDEGMFVRLLGEKTNLSKAETKQLANRLHRVWKNNTGSSEEMGKLMTLVASATGSQLASKGLGDQLGKLVHEVRKSNSSNNNSQANSDQSSTGPVQQVMSQGLSSLIGMVMGKVDLPELDANRIIGEIKSAQSELMSQAGEVAPNVKDALPGSENVIKSDIENYIHHAFIGELKSESLESTFSNVLYDADADETQLREYLSAIDRSIFSKALDSRGLLTRAEIQAIATRMEIVRQTVLRDVKAAQAIASEKRIRQQLETFLKYSPAAELSSDMGDRAFKAIIEEEPLDLASLRNNLKQLDAGYLRQFLTTRDDVQAHEISEHYARLLKRMVADAEGVEKAAKVRLEQQQQSVEDYLRSTGKPELSPEGIKRDLKALLQEPDQGISQVRGRLAYFDRDTLTALLSQRPEFSEDEVNGVIDSVEENWTAAMQAPGRLTAQAQARYDEATRSIEDYLRNTGKPELSPDGIKRDLQKLMDNPKVGARALRFRLSKMDRSTLVALLAQRGDLSASEVNSVIDSTLSTIESLIKAPRRLARRTHSSTKSQALSFQSALGDYLSNTNKDELNPEGIQRDLKLLLNDPKLGASKLSDRMAQMDESTMVALLAQRPDMSEQEAADVVGQITDVRHQVQDQIRSIEQSVQSVIDRIFARIRQYLESLDRPELNYYGIKRDVQTLFDDPQAGLGAMRERLAQFDRNTLVALVSSHDSISERDAYRVIDQIESARDGVLAKAERVEQQIESRLHSIKAQTQQQVEDTKKAAEAAAWWLFFTALLSAVVAAVGGSLAVAG